jgi:replicative DNA helicase
MFIFRQEYYDGREPPKHPGEDDTKYNERYGKWHDDLEKIHGLAEIIIAKQRHGPIGSIKLYFDAETTKFDNLSRPDHLPMEA